MNATSIPQYLKKHGQKLDREIAKDTGISLPGYAPLNTLENLVLQAEYYLNSSVVKAAFPAIGKDIKFMDVRRTLQNA